MRELEEHKVTKFNAESVTVAALDRTGANYGVTLNGADPSRNLYVRFQQGTVEAAGVNGVTEEALVALLIDRLSQEPRSENERAAAGHLRRCMGALRRRAKALGEDVE